MFQFGSLHHSNVFFFLSLMSPRCLIKKKDVIKVKQEIIVKVFFLIKHLDGVKKKETFENPLHKITLK